MRLKDGANFALLGTVKLNLEKIFNELCGVDVADREGFMDDTFLRFRDEVLRYKGTEIYSFAVGYAQDLIYEIERLLYPGKVVKNNYLDIKRMGYGEFLEYVKDPNPGDLLTVTGEDGKLFRVSIKAVVNT